MISITRNQSIRVRFESLVISLLPLRLGFFKLIEKLENKKCLNYMMLFLWFMKLYSLGRSFKQINVIHRKKPVCIIRETFGRFSTSNLEFNSYNYINFATNTSELFPMFTLIYQKTELVFSMDTEAVSADWLKCTFTSK